MGLLRDAVLAGLGLLTGVAAIAALPDGEFFVRTPAHSTDDGHGRWACAMLCYIGTRAGTCPVCGMALEHVRSGALSGEQARRMGVAVAAASQGPAVATVRAYGSVRYDERQETVVTTRLAGRVVARHGAARHPGLPVVAGESLLDLYSPEAYAAQAELAAAQRLGDAALVAALQARFAAWNLGAVAAAILAGEQASDTVRIPAPVSGVVPADDGIGPRLRVGAELDAGEVLLRIVDPQALIAVLRVPEARAAWLRLGQPVELRSDDGAMLGHSATIAWLAPGLDAATRTREAHLHLGSQGGRLLPGALVEARIRIALAPDLGPADPDDPASWGSFISIPDSAVLSTGVREVVWRLTGDDTDGTRRFAPATVLLGPRIGDEGQPRVLVREGLAVGDRIAVRGAFLIDSQAQLAGTPSLLFPSGAPSPAGAGH